MPCFLFQSDHCRLRCTQLGGGELRLTWCSSRFFAQKSLVFAQFRRFCTGKATPVQRSTTRLGQLACCAARGLGVAYASRLPWAGTSWSSVQQAMHASQNKQPVCAKFAGGLTSLLWHISSLAHGGSCFEHASPLLLHFRTSTISRWGRDRLTSPGQE